ncbi:acyl carrier protein [Thalassotalea loyana]|uniref:Acyl carrier protein n=1 Tax=Thalassotalea loyana TaxID=280483 RepID=A0ABQ6HE34_9GAMM|nr:acyl carrier protein [Thalassotalea loyana]GLX86234.1 acyl carrier protein [Thalassotalea loyana]
MSFNTVYQAIADVILEVSDIEEEELAPSSTFEEVDIDSIDYIELGLMVKKSFHVNVDSKQFESGEISNIQQLCDYIVSNMPAQVA